LSVICLFTVAFTFLRATIGRVEYGQGSAQFLMLLFQAGWLIVAASMVMPLFYILLLVEAWVTAIKGQATSHYWTAGISTLLMVFTFGYFQPIRQVPVHADERRRGNQPESFAVPAAQASEPAPAASLKAPRRIAAAVRKAGIKPVSESGNGNGATDSGKRIQELQKEALDKAFALRESDPDEAIRLAEVVLMLDPGNVLAGSIKAIAQANVKNS